VREDREGQELVTGTHDEARKASQWRLSVSLNPDIVAPVQSAARPRYPHRDEGGRSVGLRVETARRTQIGANDTVHRAKIPATHAQVKRRAAPKEGRRDLYDCSALSARCQRMKPHCLQE
jgi:hypothetical protein